MKMKIYLLHLTCCHYFIDSIGQNLSLIKLQSLSVMPVWLVSDSDRIRVNVTV